MFDWFFKKRAAPAATPPAPAAPAKTARSANGETAPRARKTEDSSADWGPRLQAAQGDDAALLQLAQTAPLLAIKLAAVQALASEAALKQAERSLRKQDSRVHRAAKLRLEETVSRRETQASAGNLIGTAAMLATETLVPLNQLVVLDRAWQALPAQHLPPAQAAEFVALRQRIDMQMQAAGQAQQQARRLAAEAAADALANTLANTLADAAQHAQRERADAESATAQRPYDEAQAAAQAAAAPSPATEPVRSAAKALGADQLHRLDAALQDAEGALAQGQLTALQRCLQAVDAAADAAGTGIWPDALLTRLHALHAERNRLRGWQQWGGARVRDELTAEAEALAALTSPAPPPAAPAPVAQATPESNTEPGDEVAPAQPPVGAPVQAPVQVPVQAPAQAPAPVVAVHLTPKINVKAHAEAIHALRQRWKELDRTGAAASTAQWQRFDTALRTAHRPVAEQHAALQAARQNNLLAREALLATLEAGAGTATGDATPATDSPPDLRAQAQALARFQAAWRQLGPLQHTVPAAARASLQERLRQAVDHIEAPLQTARQDAEAARTQLIAEAQALAQPSAMGGGIPSEETFWRVRELQHRWQQQARSLPLPRGVENALWSRFKAATDTVFAQRDSALAARDAALAEQVAALETLLARLAALPADLPGAELRRALAEVDRAWQPGHDLPRGTANALQARFLAARAAVLAQVAGSAQRHWHQQCDTLLAELALCDDLELAAPEAVSASAAPWQAPSHLPAAWAHALAQRRAQPVAAPLLEPAIDELLLQLEATLGIAPTAELVAARRSLKLQALKHTLEGRAPATPAKAQPADWLAALLAQRGAGAVQNTRLQALVAALRQAPPGTLTAPSAPG